MLAFFRDRESDGLEIVIVVQICGGFRAERAETADEALGEEGADGRRDKEGFDAHVEQAGDAADGIVGCGAC